MSDQKIVAAPNDTGVATEAGIGVESTRHGVAITNFWSSTDTETVYVDAADIPELQKALAEVLADD